MKQLSLLQLVHFLDNQRLGDVEGVGQLRKISAAVKELIKPIKEYRDQLFKLEEAFNEIVKTLGPNAKLEGIKEAKALEGYRKENDEKEVKPVLESVEYKTAVKEVFEKKAKDYKWLSNDIVIEVADFLGL